MAKKWNEMQRQNDFVVFLVFLQEDIMLSWICERTKKNCVWQNVHKNIILMYFHKEIFATEMVPLKNWKFVQSAQKS